MSLQQCRKTTNPAALATAQPAGEGRGYFTQNHEDTSGITRLILGPTNNTRNIFQMEKSSGGKDFYLENRRENCCLLLPKGGLQSQTCSRGALWKDRRPQSETAEKEIPLSYKETFFTIKGGSFLREAVESPSLVVFNVCLTKGLDNLIEFRNQH